MSLLRLEPQKIPGPADTRPEQYCLTLTLFVLGIFAQHTNNTLAADNFAFDTHFLDRSSYFHNRSSNA